MSNLFSLPTLMRSPKDDSRKWLWLTLAVTVIIILTVEVPLLNNPEYVDEDLRFFYWLHRFVNPSLFETDPLLGYQFAEINLGFTKLLFNKVSLLYGMLYAILSPLLSPFAFSKLLLFPLLLIANYFLFRIGQHITSPFAASLLSILFALIVAVPHSSISLANGLPRAFTLPLLLAMLYFSLSENQLGLAVVLILGLFYPPLFLTILLTYGIKYTYESFRRRRLALTGKPLAMLTAALLISVLLLLPAIRTGLNTVPTSTEGSQAATVFSSPLFGDEGRYPLLGPHPISANGGLLDNGLIGFYSLILVLTLIPLVLILRRRFKMLPAPFWYLGLASLIGFGISWLAILFTPSATFHMPSRYTRGTIFILGLTSVAMNGPTAIRVGTEYFASRRRNLDGLLILAAVVGLLAVYFSDISRAVKIVIGVLLIVMIFLILIIRRRSRSTSRLDQDSPGIGHPGLGAEGSSARIPSFLFTLLLLFPILFYIQSSDTFYRPEPEVAELLQFVETLPKSAIISGYPCYLDDIPLYARRMVLFSCETESRDMGMMEASLDAYFSATEGDVLAFCRRYDVDYMVAGFETFTEEFINQDLILFEPLNSFLKEELSGRSSFALEEIREDEKIFQSDSYFVFPCTPDALTSTR